MDRIRCLLPSDITLVDSSTDKYEGFVAIHFTIYCKYSEHVGRPSWAVSHPLMTAVTRGTRTYRLPRLRTPLGLPGREVQE